MGASSVLSLSCALVALHAALWGGFVYAQRPQERAHLWLVVAALGVVQFAVASAFVHASHEVGAAEPWQRAMLAASLPMGIGLFRLSFELLGLEARRLRGLVTATLLGVFALTLCPGLVFDGVPVEHPRQVLGAHPVESGMDAVGSLAFAALGVLSLLLIGLHVRHVRRLGRSAPAVLAALGIWAAASANDMGVALGLLGTPCLLGSGHAFLVVAFSALLMRRFVSAKNEAERLAENLHLLVNERTEELRRKNLQIEDGARMAAVGTLAAGVAHEINNPIAYVSSGLNRLAEIQFRGVSEEEAKDAAEILAECQDGLARVRGIVCQLQGLAERSEGRDERVDLPRLVASVLSMTPVEPGSRSRIVADLAPVPPVSGDARLLGQLVLRLVQNALEAAVDGTGARGSVTVRTAFEDGCVRLQVRDEGPGIPADALPRIFDPFFSTKSSERNPGLGLAVSRQIVSRHRGRISVATGSQGTTFTVDLPPASGATQD
jgi:signal transduction histidine kinase